MEATYYGGYNGGIANPTTSYHAHVDTDTFGFPVYEYNESDGTRNWKGTSTRVNDFLTPGKTGDYTIGFDLYATGTGTKIYGGFYYTKVGGTTQDFHAGQYTIPVTTANTWVRLSSLVSLGSDVDYTKDIMFYIYGYGFTTNSILYMRKPKLEKGNRATDWSLSVEDLSTTITDIMTKVTNVEDKVKDDSIISTVTTSQNFQRIIDVKANSDDLSNYATTGALDGVANGVDGKITDRINQLNLTGTYATKSEMNQTATAITRSPRAGAGGNYTARSRSRCWPRR
jgi:hypothetical protein